MQEIKDSNSVFRMLVYNVLAVIFESAQANQTNKINEELLTMVKCTLYSKDLKLSAIKNAENSI